MINISFGGDPEFMLKDKHGNLKSAIGIVPGTKEERYDLGDGHAVYYDNVLAECQIKPSKTKEEAVENFRICFQRAATLVSPYILVPQASAIYPEEECEHEDAKRFGCSPEYDAYEVNVVQPPDCLTTFRTGGGHIHIGYDGGKDFAEAPPGVDLQDLNNQIAWGRLWVARMCDIFIGLPSLFLDTDPTSKERRKLYGGAGTHRGCLEYGVEYRTLSNFWLRSPKLVSLMYELSALSATIVSEKESYERIWGQVIDPDTLRSAINSWDSNKGKELFASMQGLIPASLRKRLVDMINEPKGQLEFYTEWNIKP